MPAQRPDSQPASCPVPWLDEKRGYFVDWLTQIWVKLTGRVVPIDPDSWLDVPFGDVRVIGESYLGALTHFRDLRIQRNSESGLIERFDELRGASFEPSSTHPEIVQFYEHTAEYNLALEAQWGALLRPFGWMIAFTFSRRLQQLNLPVCKHDADGEISSEIVQFRDSEGKVCLTSWFRTFERTKQAIYVGFYSHCSVPGKDQMVRVAFPIPNGCALVMMKPIAEVDGSLRLLSEGRAFGDSGFYFLLRRDDRTIWVRNVRSLKESIHVRVDGEGLLSAVHEIKLWGIHGLRMRYRMARKRARPCCG